MTLFGNYTKIENPNPLHFLIIWIILNFLLTRGKGTAKVPVANIADPDQMSDDGGWSGSTLFAILKSCLAGQELTTTTILW